MVYLSKELDDKSLSEKMSHIKAEWTRQGVRLSDMKSGLFAFKLFCWGLRYIFLCARICQAPVQVHCLSVLSQQANFQDLTVHTKLPCFNWVFNIQVELDLAFNNVKPKDRYFVLD